MSAGSLVRRRGRWILDPMTESIFRIEVGVSSASDETVSRCREIIERLKEQHEVTGEEPIWRVTYVDFDSREDALNALRRQLDRIAPDWSDFLSVG